MAGRAWRIGIWAAVSSRAQATEDKTSLDEQIQAGERFAVAIGGQVVARYVVPGQSRDYWNWYEIERDVAAYRQVRADLEAGRLDVIHAVDADRLGRDTALVQQFYSLAGRHGCEVYLASAPHELGQQREEHRFLPAFLSVQAGADQARRIRRHRLGMKARVQRGMIANHPPTGYEAIRDSVSGLVTGYQFNADIGAVRTMTELFLRGFSYSEIMRRLNNGNVLSPTGRRWKHNTIYGILHNDTYAGLPDWGPYQSETPAASFPVLWDTETHTAILAERRRRESGKAPYVRRGGGPLTGVAFCNRCGGPMTRYRYTDKGRGYVYLNCARHRRKSITGISCHHNNIAEWRVLEAVAQFLESIITPEALDMALASLADEDTCATRQAELDAAHTRIADIERQRERLALALAGGQMDAAIYRVTDDRLLARLETEQERGRDLARELETVPDVGARREALSKLAGQFRELAASADPAEIAAMLQAAGIRVWIEDNQVVRVSIG